MDAHLKEAVAKMMPKFTKVLQEKLDEAKEVMKEPEAKKVVFKRVIKSKKPKVPKFKVLEAISQTPSTLYKIPDEWAIEDIVVRYGILYYKGEEKECPTYEVEGQQKYAELEITDDYDIDEYFDCE